MVRLWFTLNLLLSRAAGRQSWSKNNRTSDFSPPTSQPHCRKRKTKTNTTIFCFLFLFFFSFFLLIVLRLRLLLLPPAPSFLSLHSFTINYYQFPLYCGNSSFLAGSWKRWPRLPIDIIQALYQVNPVTSHELAEEESEPITYSRSATWVQVLKSSQLHPVFKDLDEPPLNSTLVT
jgi:hypothetical protein